jgi:hypothetical protein
MQFTTTYFVPLHCRKLWHHGMICSNMCEVRFQLYVPYTKSNSAVEVHRLTTKLHSVAKGWGCVFEHYRGQQALITPTLHHHLYASALSLSTHPRTHKSIVSKATFVLFLGTKTGEKSPSIKNAKHHSKDQHGLLQMQETTSRKVTDKTICY